MCCKGLSGACLWNMTDRFSVAQESKSDLDRLIVEISRTHTHTHTHAHAHAHAHTHTHTHTHAHGKTPLNEWSSRRRGRYLHEQKRRTSTISEWFESTVPPIGRLQTCALDGTAVVCRIWVCNQSLSLWNNHIFRHILQYLFHPSYINSSTRRQSFRHGTSNCVLFLPFKVQDLVFVNATYSNSSPIFVYCCPIWNFDICSRIKEGTSVVYIESFS